MNMKTCSALAGAALLAGCAAITSPLDEDYQLGDLTASALSLQAQYCATADPRERAIRLAVLRSAGVPIPPSGACADILALVPDAEVNIDTSETEADRERFNSEER
jgi:hypothetical protein